MCAVGVALTRTGEETTAQATYPFGTIPISCAGQGVGFWSIGERAMENFRGWERGRRAMLALPGWLCVLLMPYFAWLDVIVPRPRLVLVASLAAFGLLATLKCSIGIPNGDGELGWNGVGLLAAGLLWASFSGHNRRLSVLSHGSRHALAHLHNAEVAGSG